MILALRALGLGDLATAVPALRGLRAAFPGEPLALAAPAGLTPLIGLIGGVGPVVPTGGLDAALPDSLHPQVAVNLHGRGPQSHRLLRQAAPGKLWAFANEAASFADGPPWILEGAGPAQTTPHPGWVGTNVAPADDGPTRISTDERISTEDPTTAGEEHEVARWCRLLRYYGVPADPADLGLAVPAVDVPRGVTIIHPGAKSGTRRWPAARFGSVARALRAAGHTVLVTASADERALAVRVAVAAGLDASAVPATGLAELAALVAHARLVISGDTGIAHLATAYATPSVTLFGPMSPARWGPPPRPYHRALWHGTRSEPGDRPGPPHPALLAIGEREVLDAAAEVLG